MSDRPTPSASQAASEGSGNKETEQLLKQATQLTAKLEKASKDCEELQQKLASATDALQKEKAQGRAKISKLERAMADLEQQLGTEKKKAQEMAEAAAAREERQKTQLEGMGEQIDKLRAVLKQRDEELVHVQGELLAKKDAEAAAHQETGRLRPGLGQGAVKDTSVLQRRVTDLEIELEHLKKAMENDPKFKVYLLVRETGQRTLEELSKVLGVGRLEAQRRVQELVRSGLLLLREDNVLLAQGRTQTR